MGGMHTSMIKEAEGKVFPTVPEIKDAFERIETRESFEFSELSDKKVNFADVYTAKYFSLSALVEANKERDGLLNNQIEESDKVKEARQGLTDEQKEQLRESKGWSDEILDNIGSWEEAQIYIDAGLEESEVNGKKCLIRDDIDLNQVDEDGISNKQRMERGRPPITKDGQEIELHHIGQKQNSPLAELTVKQHRGPGNDSILHDKSKESEINRNEFGKERQGHWKNRVGIMEGGE